jgi:hypothetical protein
MQTLAAIRHHLHSPDLAGIVSDYLCPRDAEFWDIIRYGHHELATTHEEAHGNNWSNGLCIACCHEHLPIIQFMIDQGANDWNYGLRNACCYGHIEAARLMIAHGATDHNIGLDHACWGNHVEIARLMLSHGAKLANCNIDACRGTELRALFGLPPHPRPVPHPHPPLSPHPLPAPPHTPPN